MAHKLAHPKNILNKVRKTNQEIKKVKTETSGKTIDGG
jgi:hypothetical protein